MTERAAGLEGGNCAKTRFGLSMLSFTKWPSETMAVAAFLPRM
jgi:hypothetical protein